MRDGELVADAPSSEWTKRDLIAAMVGRTVDFPDRPTSVTETVVLRARSVTVRPSAPRIDISVRQGEIVGMWGLVGSGRTTFLRSLAGLEPTSSGELQLLGRSVPWPRRPVDSQRAGISLLAEDRRQSLVRSMNAVDNYWIGNGHSSLGLIRRRRERTEAQAQVKRFAFDERRLNAPVGRLSGGNQQKALLAKWAGRRPSVLLIDEPTRGIDIGAKAEVLESLSALANEGAAIVMTSSELEEVLHLSDRILVFADGAVVAEIPRGSEGFDVQSIVHQGFKSEASE
jgi:ribose transport system ATP-binding protein/rhamnose transport system ATP-binding protein